MSNAFTVSEPNEALINELALNVQETDKKAFAMFGCTDVAETISKSILGHPCAFITMINGRPVSLVDITDADGSFAERNGVLRMIASKTIHNYPVTFLRRSLELIGFVMKSYKRLYAKIDMSDETNMRYAKFLGFKDSQKRDSENGITFGLFVKEGK